MNKKPKRIILSKMGISGEMLINEFISGMTLKSIAKKYNRTDGRIIQIIRKLCDDLQYEQYKKQHRENKKASKLNKFMSYAKALGRVPDLNEALSVIPGIVANYYQFRKIAEANGLVYTSTKKRGRRRRHTQEQLLTHLRELASKLGYTPSCNQIYAEGKYTHNMYITCFGSLQAAQKLAGLKPNAKYNSVENARRGTKYISRENCIEDLKRIHKELGAPPSVSQLKKHGSYSVNIYYSRLGGIKKIKQLPELKIA